MGAIPPSPISDLMPIPCRMPTSCSICKWKWVSILLLSTFCSKIGEPLRRRATTSYCSLSLLCASSNSCWASSEGKSNLKQRLSPRPPSNLRRTTLCFSESPQSSTIPPSCDWRSKIRRRSRPFVQPRTSCHPFCTCWCKSWITALCSAPWLSISMLS